MTPATANGAVRRLAVAHRSATSELLKRAGVAIGQELLVLKLAEAAPCTQAELASAAGCEPSTITMAVRKLESAGLVMRTPSTTDARAVSVQLTPGGLALVPALEEAQARLAEQIASALPPEVSLEDFVAALDSVASALTTWRPPSKDVVH